MILFFSSQTTDETWRLKSDTKEAEGIRLDQWNCFTIFAILIINRWNWANAERKQVIFNSSLKDADDIDALKLQVLREQWDN